MLRSRDIVPGCRANPGHPPAWGVRVMFLQGRVKMVRLLLLGALCVCALPAVAAEEATFIGSKACGECHEGEYSRFQTYSKKAKSWHSVSVMASKLTPEELRGCYTCHTTGHGKGGFVDVDKTPHLADVGCETCHGPGGRHAESGDPADIRRTPRMEDCVTCHNSTRVKAFNFKPLIASGAH